MATRLKPQRGQALLLVLTFLAAFLFLIWAALTLASSAFLNLNSIQADTRHTYALDAGVDFFIELARNTAGNPCTKAIGGTFTLTYPTTSETVTVTKTGAAPGCSRFAPVLDLQVTSSSTSRILTAEVALVGTGWTVNWESYQ